MAGEVEVDSYELFAPEAERVISLGLVVSTTRWKTASEFYFCQRKRKRQSSLRAREAFGRHGAGCVTSFSVTRSRPRAVQSEAPPGGGLA